MADSRFLKFQDVDNDGLIDVCDDLINTPESPCKGPCTPNPAAINPQWKNRNIDEPFLNEKKCLYQVTKVTPHTKIKADVDDNFEEFKEEAIDSLLNFYDKDESHSSKEKMRENITFDRYDLDPHPNTRLKLLYSVPFDIIYELPMATPDPEPFEDEEPGTVKVTFNAAQLTTQIIRVRKGLGMYGRLLKVYRSIGEGNAYYKANRTIFNLEDYGDMGFLGDSIMNSLMNDLEGFLDAKNFRLPGQFFGMFSSDSLITKLKFVFNDYELQSMRIWTVGCGNKPFYLSKKKLKPLRAQGPWKDKTAVAYFAQLPKMARALNARVQIPWQDFVEKYTYPKVFFDIKEENTEKTIGSCVADALADEFKELGQDILDEVFSIGDAVAYLWRKSICRDSINESLSDDFLAGLYPGDGKMDMTKAYGMASEQAFGKLSKDDNVFVMLCMSVVASSSNLGSVSSLMGTMYKFGFQRIKICGLFDLLQSVIQCLTGGLTLDEALSKMLMSALQNMGIEQFGDLFGGLPEHKQRELGAMVEKQLKEGSFFATNTGAIPKPWEVQSVIDKEREELKEDNFEGMVPTPNTQRNAPGKYERTLVQQNDRAAGGLNGIPVDNIMQAYVAALLEYYSDNLFELLDELNKFPGAQIIAGIIGMLDCPNPPLLNPSFPDFIKSIIFPFCDTMGEFSLPRLESPLQYFPDFADITQFIWMIAKFIIMQIVWRILMVLMVKICELIGNAICKALEVGGAIIGALPGAIAGTADLTQVIKDTICGPEADDKQVEDTILDLMSQLGLGSAAFANRDRTLQFGLDLSSSVTTSEMTNALLGSPSAIFLEIADHLIEHEYPEFREGIQNRKAIERFFKNIGNLIPVDARSQLEDAANRNIWAVDGFGPESVEDMMPVNPSMCSTPEQIEQFKALRCQLLEGRATPEQCHEMFCDIREDTLEDLGDLSDILQGGLGNHIIKNMPPLVSEPGCDDGIFPFESPQQAAMGTFALSGDLEMLKIDYGKDMMGNGNFWNSDSQWGFMNMMLSDTQGFALTSHHSKASNEKAYVNYATNLPNGGESTSGFFSFFQFSQGFSGQIGQYPYYVGEWMKRQLLNASMSDSMRNSYIIKPGFYSLSSMGNDLRASLQGSGYGFRSTNKSSGKQKYYIDFEKLQYNNFFGSLTQGVNLFMVPDFGYNTTLYADQSTDKVVVTRQIRKGTGIKVNGGGGSSEGRSLYTPAELGCDLVLDFRDNAAGMRYGPQDLNGYISTNEGGKATGLAPGGHWGTEWSYGYEIQCYFNDIHEDENGRVLNRFDDNIRLELVEKVNYGSDHLGPLGKAMEDEMTKMEPFDLPNWIEGIPIVGWAIESVINLILLPFTQLVLRNIKRLALRWEEEVHRIREFEFISVDDGLDVFYVEPDPNKIESPSDWPKISDYPEFSRIKNTLTSQSPPILLLADMTGLSKTAAEAKYNSTMNMMFKKLAYEIGDIDNKSGGWLYGADYDYLTQDDIRYGVVDGNQFVPYGISGYEEEDMELGISYDQFMNPENPRVIYLNPAIYGGSYSKPNLHIKPLQYKGWMGFVQVFFPENTACKPHSVDLVDFGEIEDFIQEHFPKMADDPRLTQDRECVREVPFKRIMTRAGKTGMYSLIMAAIRVYASTHLFKAMGTFSQIMPKFPDNFSSIYAAYITERIEEDFRNAPDGFWGWAQSFKDDEFWYGFLEQSVECYNFLVEAGEIELPRAGGYLQSAFDTINDLQTEYEFPMRPTHTRTYTNSEGKERTQTVEGLWDAKMSGEAGFFQTLKGYRSDENFEAVQSVEEHAKLILQQLVNFELTKMGEKLVENMRQYGFNPRIFDLDYYIFQEMNSSNVGGGGVAGSVNGPLLFAGPKQVDIIQALPTPENPDPRGEGVSWPGPYYTQGSEFRIAINNDPNDEFSYADEYTGYYHGHIDEEGDVIYMVGERHSPAEHDVLTPVDNLVAVGTEAFIEERVDVDAVHADASGRSTYEPGAGRERQSSPYPKMKTEKLYIGTVPEYGTAVLGDAEKPYAIEQYVSINGEKMTPSAARSRLRMSDNELRISDVYPGTLELVRNDLGIEVGIRGNIGVRYGLAFYYVDGMKKLITTVEVDSLDVKISQWNIMQPSSKLLMCLLNKLKEDEKYKLMTNYIFPLKKVTAIWAIYNDYGIMSSLGEVTPGSGDDTMWLPTGLAGALAGILGVPAGDVSNPNDWLDKTPFTQVKVKPGSRAYIHKNVKEESIAWGRLSESFKDAVMPFRVPWYDDAIEYEIVSYDPQKSGITGNEGWANFADRGDAPLAGWWRTTWDEWDRRLLRNSVYRIKKLFKTYYYSRDYRPGDDLLGDSDKPSNLFLKNLKAAMFPIPGKSMLPWWQRGRLRSSPFNAKGDMCNGKD